MSRSTSCGGTIEIACFVHMFPVEIFLFKPDSGSPRMKWMTTFVSAFGGSSRSHDLYLLYSGSNHYDCIADPVFGPLELSTVCTSAVISHNVDDSAGVLDHQVTVLDDAAVVKPRRIRYQSIIATRLGNSQRKLSRVTEIQMRRNVSTKLDFRSRAMSATRRLVEAFRPFNYFFRCRALTATRRLIQSSIPFSCYCGNGVRRLSSNISPSRNCSDSSDDAVLYSTTMESMTKFKVCAICGYEGTRVGCVPVSEIDEFLELSGIASMFNYMVSPDRVRTRYDSIFNIELKYVYFLGYFPDLYPMS